MSSKSKRNRNWEGRRPPLSIRDQADAAIAENFTQNEDRVARGARGYEMLEAEAPPIYQSLIDAYRLASEWARDRYEGGISQPQRVSGRSRWVACEHLQGGPAPSHWNPCSPEVLLCTACWKPADVGLTYCGRCGRHDHKLTHISVLDQHSVVTLHAAVCDDCYPEGSDAPKVDDAR